jgi:RNA polymerase sigma-70 factor (ECF subfamily)
MTTTNSEAQDRADMRALAAGQDAALNPLMERHAAGVFRFLTRMVGNEDDAGDLAQETFVRVYRGRESYRPAQPFRTWLYTIAANLARNHHRWRSRHPNLSLETRADDEGPSLGDTLVEGRPGPHDAAARAELAASVRAAIQGLPADLREAVVLCEWEELPVAEAARLLQATPKAVESRLYRARKLLRERFRKWL